MDGFAVDDLRVWAGIALTVLDALIVILLVPRILGQRRESGATLAWIFFIVLVPFLGLIAFWVLGTTRLRLRRRKRRRIEQVMTARLDPLWGARPALHIDDLDACPADDQIVRLTRRLEVADPSQGNAVELLRDGPETFATLERAIDEAQHHVHLEFYIWEPDSTGSRLRDALVRAVHRDVEVRVLVDDVGSRKLPRDFWRALRLAGGRAKRFLPVNLFSRRLALNNRNHRKLVVVDGRVGFTGGMNVGDEYAGLAAPWRDALVRVEGPAVLRFQEVFAHDWYHATGEDLAHDVYFPAVVGEGDVWVQLLSSGPDDLRWHAIHVLLFTSISMARERVWLETPYFVPDPPTALALQAAALRGVDVRLLLPGSSDHPLVLYAGRSFYSELLAAGVRIWELPKTMLHAKTATIDGRFATVGSANLDQRSFRLNFEANAFFYGPQMAQALEATFQAIQAEAREVTLEAHARRGAWKRGLEATTRVLAPVL